MKEYWGKTIFNCGHQFNRILKLDDPRPAIRYYVDQFGRHGPQADFRWLIADIRFTLPTFRKVDFQFDDAKTKNAKMYFCECQVRKFASDEHYLHRYYGAALFTRLFLGGTEPEEVFQQSMCFDAIMEDIGDGFTYRKEEYWWHARSFVLIAHATGRDDLIRGGPASELAARFREYHRWLIANRKYLTVHKERHRWVLPEDRRERAHAVRDRGTLPKIALPELPFADWDGPLPLHPATIRQL